MRAPDLRVAMLICLALLATGCGRGSVEDQLSKALEKDNKTNIQKTTSCYLIYQALNGMSPPKSLEQLRTFITTHKSPEKALKRMGLKREDFDSYLIGRDGEPLTIKYGVRGISGPDSPNSAIIFEAVGVDGVRQVSFNDREIKEISDHVEYDRLLNEKKSKSSKKYDMYD
jgi:hypothetical protein